MMANRVDTQEELKFSDIIDVSSIKKEILRKNEITEILKILGCTPVDFVDLDLVSDLYDKGEEKYRSHYMALAGVYLMGYIYGIRAERKRREGMIKNKLELNQ